jgi:hypothetical protein
MSLQRRGLWRQVRQLRPFQRSLCALLQVGAPYFACCRQAVNCIEWFLRRRRARTYGDLDDMSHGFPLSASVRL